MTIRTLDPSEWSRLPPHEGVELLDVDSAMVIAAEDDAGEIIGFWCLQICFLAEPAWVSEDVRGTPVAHRLYLAMKEALAEKGVENFILHTNQEKVAEYLERLGLQSDGLILFQGTTKD